MRTQWKRQFATLWVGQAVSILTSSISQYALIWHLTAQTGSAAVLSLAAVAPGHPLPFHRGGGRPL